MSALPAEVKKKESIAEYIIHMYQTEDLILNYKLNLDDILEYVLKQMSSDEETLKSLILWYADVIEQMHNERVVETGKRLSTTQDYVNRLTDIHAGLLDNDKAYQTKYNGASEDIKYNIKLSNNEISNPIQICLNGIYGMLLLRLIGEKITDDQQLILAKFGAVLEYLSEAYKKEFPQSE